MDCIDLHVHSTASDGTVSPSQTVRLAKAAALKAMALTDHDTVAGIEEALEAGSRLEVRVIPGIEVSSLYEGREIHILGLFVNHHAPALLDSLEAFRQVRRQRNAIILSNLEAAGIHLTPEAITGKNPDTVITRAHLARALTSLGYASSMNSAFKRYLEPGGPFCPPKKAPSPEEVVSILLANGAFVSLAHPCLYKLGDQEICRLAARLSDLGMEGLEVYHSSHNPCQTRKLQTLAQDLGLFPTGGSDFHGSNKPDISMGTGRGGLCVPLALLERIDAHRASLPA